MADATLVTSFVVVRHKVKFSARYMTLIKLIWLGGCYQAGQTDSLFRSNRCKCRTSGFTLRTSWSCFRTAWTSSFSSQLNSSSCRTKNKQTKNKTLTRSSCNVFGNVVNRGIPFFLFPTAPQSCPLNDPNTDSIWCWQFFIFLFFKTFTISQCFPQNVDTCHLLSFLVFFLSIPHQCNPTPLYPHLLLRTRRCKRASSLQRDILMLVCDVLP